MAPMAGACPAQLAAAVSNAGGLGSCGALLMDAEQIAQWAEDFRTQSNGAFMLNNWIPDPEQNEMFTAAIRFQQMQQ